VNYLGIDFFGTSSMNFCWNNDVTYIMLVSNTVYTENFQVLMTIYIKLDFALTVVFLVVLRIF